MSKLLVLHLEDDPAIRSMLVSFHRDIARAIEEYFNKHHPGYIERRCEGHSNDFLEIVSVNTVSQLMTTLISQDGHPTDEAKRCLFLLLDFYVPLNEDCEAEAIGNIAVNGMFFEEWLELYLPSIPVVYLTQSDVRDKVLNDRDIITKSIFQVGTEAVVGRLKFYFSQWWDCEFWENLREHTAAENYTSWHTPGHCRGNAFRGAFQADFIETFGEKVFQTDLSVSVDALGDLSEPGVDSPLTKAQRRAAITFGASDTYFITNGTSTSNKAMLMTLLKPGEKVLLDRNCHKSVHQAIVMAGADPSYLTPGFNTELGIWAPLSYEAIEKAVHDAKDNPPRMLILTTCTYDGVLYPIDRLARLCQSRGILLYADEAWAPYLRFHPQYVRMTKENGLVAHRTMASLGTASTPGAHFVVHSTHKALAAFSQASMIHIGRRVRELIEQEGDPQWLWLRERFSRNGQASYDVFQHQLNEVLRYWHSTSPNYPILATLERAGVQMRLEGIQLLDEKLSELKSWTEWLVKEVGHAHWLLSLDDILGDPLGADEYRKNGYCLDPLKLSIKFSSAESCSKFLNVLRENNIVHEKATCRVIEFLVTIGSTTHHFSDLFKLLKRHEELLASAPVQTTMNTNLADGVCTVLPRDAVLGTMEYVLIEDAEDRISTQMVTPYPPGIPTMLPGVMITRSAIDAVRSSLEGGGAHAVHGLLFDEDEQAFMAVQPGSGAKLNRYGEDDA